MVLWDRRFVATSSRKNLKYAAFNYYYHALGIFSEINYKGKTMQRGKRMNAQAKHQRGIPNTAVLIKADDLVGEEGGI